MKIIVIFSLFFSSSIFSSEKSICGQSDDRTLSFEKPIGRSGMKGYKMGCTVTLISNSCAISVGHCVDAFKNIQFNVPLSINSEPTLAHPNDIYNRNKDFLRYSDNGKGDDWAILKLNPNPLTNLYPGEVQGFYSIAKNMTIKKGMKVRITGFGEDRNDGSSNFSQQTHSGTIKKLGGGIFTRKFKLGYEVDTTVGNSGSPVILSNTNTIIGVHSFGTCSEKKDYNEGTLILNNKQVMFAIQQCLDTEEKE